MAESKVGRGKLSEQLSRTVAEIKEKEGIEGVNRFIVKRLMDLEDKATGGDDFLFWYEANAIDSAHRINALNEKNCEFYGESAKFAVEMCIKKGLPKSYADEEVLIAEVGMYTEESKVLHEEYAKSVAELCIKKMRLGALVDKRDKRTTLMLEIKKAWKIGKEFGDKFTAFKKSLAMKQQQDSYAHAIVQENARGKGQTQAFGFEFGSFRILVEMMRGVKAGQQPVKGLDDAMALGKSWCDAVINKCVMKVWVGIMMEGRSVFEVLKSEIAENWKMEKEVKDRIFDYQRELAQGFVTDIVEEEMTEVSPQPRLEGDETIEVKKSEMGTVVHGEESEGGAVVEGYLTKAGHYAAVGMIAAFADLAIVKAKRMCMMTKLKVD